MKFFSHINQLKVSITFTERILESCLILLFLIVIFQSTQGVGYLGKQWIGGMDGMDGWDE